MAAEFPEKITTQLKTAVNNLQYNLTDDVGENDTEINVNSTAGAPASGSFHIENEIIFYDSKTSLKFTECTRGADGTTKAVHLKIAEGGEVKFGPEAHFVNTPNDEIIETQKKVGKDSDTNTDSHDYKLRNLPSQDGTTKVTNLNSDKLDNLEGATLKANEIIIMADGFKIDGSACELVEEPGTAAKCYYKHLAVAKTEWFDTPKFRVPDTYDGGDIVINVCFRSAGVSKTHSLGIRVASVATTEVHNPDLAAAYQLYNEEVSEDVAGEVKIKTVTVTQANHLMVAGEIWHCKFVMEDDAECDADDVLIDWIVIEWNKG